MIKGIYFGLGFFWHSKERTILEISERMICLFQDLASMDVRFSAPHYSSRKGQNIKIDIASSDGVRALAESLKISLESDILEHDGTTKPNLSFKREFGFSASFEFKDQDISLSGRLGSSKAEGLSFSFSGNFEESSDWYLQLLKTCIVNTSSFFGSMQLKIAKVTKQINDIKYPIGIITYYADNLSLNIGGCLEGLEVIQEDAGFYVVLSHESITDSKEFFDGFKRDLILVNQKLRQCDAMILRELPPG